MDVTIAEAAVGVGVAVTTVALLLSVSHDGPPAGTDEGYLWYGVLRAAEGDVPLRDIRSYEPGRYWWSVPFVLALGRGLRVVRVAAAAMFTVGLAGVLVVMRGAGGSWIAVGLAAVLATLWSVLPHKRYDQGVLLGVVAACGWLLASPGVWSAAVAGLVVGLAAVVGLNLGLYATVATGLVGLVVVMRVPGVDDGVIVAGGMAGAAVGSAPLWITLVFVPGFREAVWARRVAAVVARGSTNLHLQVPLPWRPDPRHLRLRPGPAAGRTVVTWLHVVVPTLALAGVIAMIVAPIDVVTDQAVGVAAATVTIAAWHQVWSRADVGHLAVVMPVSVVGLAAVLAESPAGLATLVAVAVPATLVVVATDHPISARRARPDAMVRRRIGERRELWLWRHQAAAFDQVGPLLDATDASRPVVAVPSGVWLLPLFNRRSAVYDTFCVYPASPAEEERMLAEIENGEPSLVLVDRTPLDGRADLAFPATHPRVWAYINDRFRAVDPSDDPVLASLCVFVPAEPDH